MRAILAVSADGYLAKGQNDDMTWSGPTDKAIFRILTCTGSLMAASRNTVRLMPSKLPGRTLVALSSQGYVEHESWGTLHEFSVAYPDAWLIGGPKLVMQALEAGMLHEVHLCRSLRQALPEPEALPIEDEITPWLKSSSNKAEITPWFKNTQTLVNDVLVEFWRPYVTI